MADLFDRLIAHQDVVRKAGAEYTAWCPWHDDRGGKPSLRINPTKRIVKCFSPQCGKSGFRKLAQAWGIEDEDGRKRKSPPALELTEEQARVRLQEKYQLHRPTLSHFKIEVRLTTKAPDRTSTGAWSYPTPAGTRYKAIQPGSNGQKYWWARGGSQEKRGSVLYGLTDVPRDAERVYLVNGEPSVWTCWQAGLPAVSSYGEGSFKAEHAERLAQLRPKVVVVALDLDKAGEVAAYNALHKLRGAGLEAFAIKLPDYLGDHADVSDVYRWHGADDTAFKAALQDLGPWEPPNPKPLDETPYHQEGGRFFATRATKDGPVVVELTNFVAEASEEIEVDDGERRDLLVTMTGQLAGGERLPDVQIPAADATSSDWIGKRWGYRARINAGRGNADAVREIMQRLSEGMPRRSVRSHTGFAKIAGKWTYLMPARDSSPNNLAVELDPNYVRYHLPAQPKNVQDAVKASWRFLDIADRRVTVPLWAFAYLAPLQSILRPSFTIWMRARTGAWKSTIAALVMCHFGEFEYNTPPMTWESTARGIERFMYDMKDCLAWVDDFAPRETDRDVREANTKADMVIRPMGNRMGRSRMGRDTRAKRNLPPRALLISTGEVFPAGESLRARFFPVEFSSDMVNLDDLTLAQQGEAADYPHAMGAYVRWLADRYTKLETTLPDRVVEIRDQLTSKKAHPRIRESVSLLQLALELACEFALDVGAKTSAEVQELRKSGVSTLLRIGAEHARLVESESPADLVLEVLDALLVNERVVFFERGSHERLPIGKEKAGWYDHEAIYLQPTVVYNLVSKFLRVEGQALPFGRDSLGRLFAEAGLILRRSGGHYTESPSLNGSRHRVLVLDKAKVPFGEALISTVPETPEPSRPQFPDTHESPEH